MTDLLAGHVPLMFLSISGVLPLMQSDKIKVIAVLAKQRLAQFPDVPTIAETGYPGIEAAVWFGSLVPRGVPDAIQEKLLNAFRQGATMPDVHSRFAKLGLQTTLGTPKEFLAVMKEDYEKYRDVAGSLNLNVE